MESLISMNYIESKNVELKERYTSSFLKTVSAFANYNGGTVVFGVDDSGNIKGLNDANEVKLQIENSINDSITPQPIFELRTVQVDDKSIVELIISQGIQKPYFYKHKAYRRSDTSTVSVDNPELKKMIMMSEGIEYERLPSTQDSLEFEVLSEFAQSKLSIEGINLDLLRTLGLYEDDHYNRAGQLIADQNTLKESGMDFARIGDSDSIFLERDTISMKSLLTQYKKALNHFDKWYKPYEEVSGFYRETRIQIPREAFREAIANAIVHRDFLIPAYVKVSFYNDRIEIVSPGGLPMGISEKEYLSGNISLPRNRTVALVFNRLGIIELFASGIKRINQEYEKYNEKPVFDVLENSIRIVLPKIEYKENINELNIYEFILQLLNDNGDMSRQELEDATGYKKASLIRTLDFLINENKIVRKGKSRGIKYSIK